MGERSEGKDRARLHTKLDRNTPPTAPRRRTPTHARTHPKHTQTQQHVGPLRDVPGREPRQGRRRRASRIRALRVWVYARVRHEPPPILNDDGPLDLDDDDE